MPRNRGARHRLEPGLYQDDAGYAAVVSVGSRKTRLIQREKRFPRGTPRREMREWITRTRALLMQERDLLRAVSSPASPAAAEFPALHRASDGTLREDAAAYLELVTSLASYEARVSDLAHWTRRFGSRPTLSITVTDVRRVVNAWTLAGHKANSIKHRMTALSQLFEALYPAALNPVRKVARPSDADQPPRALDLQDVADLFAAMPDSATKARWRVMYTTGLPPARIMRLRPEDVNRKARTLRLEGRRKGQGTAGKLIPISAAAVAAFDDLDRLNGWGRFASRGTSPSWHRAWRKANATRTAEAKRRGVKPTLIPPCRPYDLRHTFGTLLAMDHDIQTVAALLDCTIETALRYTRAAVPKKMRAAIADLETRTGQSLAPGRGPRETTRSSARNPRLPKPARRVRFP